MSSVPEFIGRLHPLVIHFPIALILVAAAFEIVRIFCPGHEWRHAVPALLFLGGLGALVAVVTGQIFSSDFHPAPSDKWMLPWHRGLGIATVVVAFGAALVSSVAGAKLAGLAVWVRRAMIALAVALVVVTAHFGGLMVWGRDFFFS